MFVTFLVFYKSDPSREVLKSQICILTLFVKINFSRKFPDLQYNFNFVHLFSYLNQQIIISIPNKIEKRI